MAGVPEDLGIRSHVGAWFKCSTCGHIWQTEIKTRTIGKAGCPMCNVGETTDLRDFPSALAQFDVKKNKHVDPHLLPFSKEVWWSCERAKDHVWFTTFNRKGTTRCPFCRGVKASSTNNLTLFKRNLLSDNHPFCPNTGARRIVAGEDVLM